MAISVQMKVFIVLILSYILYQSGKEGTEASWSSSKLRIAQPTPKWKALAVINETFHEIRSTDYLGRYLILLFYPLDFDRIKEFNAHGADVVACSVDSHFTHLAWMKTSRKDGGLGNINIPLLSDSTHEISKKFGVYLEDAGHSERALFVIDTDGILRQITVNDLSVGRSVDEILRMIQALKYTDEHGEVCPADWKPGKPTIIPDPSKKLKYFNKVSDEL